MLNVHAFPKGYFMIVDKSTSASTNSIDMKDLLCQIVEDNRISLISMMSDLTGINEEQIRYLLEELVEEGTLEGSFTPDGQRFFLSEVTVSTAPVAPTKDEGYHVEKRDTKLSKLIFIIGVVLIVAGYIVRNLVSLNEILEHIGVGVLMIGLVVLASGWLMFSRANPPSRIK